MAVAHAPAPTRPALTALFALDERLGAIVASTTEPIIGLMRLAWWREALERLTRDAAPAEPLLRRLAQDVVPRGVAGAMLAGIEDGWAALLDGDGDAAAIARHGRERGGMLFRCAWRLLASPTSLPLNGPRPYNIEGVGASLGEGWALADLGHRHSLPEVRAEARRQARAVFDGMTSTRWPAAVRPLAALAALARRDARAEDARAQGSPGRMLRMLAMRITGR